MWSDGTQKQSSVVLEKFNFKSHMKFFMNKSSIFFESQIEYMRTGSNGGWAHQSTKISTLTKQACRPDRNLIMSQMIKNSMFAGWSHWRKLLTLFQGVKFSSQISFILNKQLPFKPWTKHLNLFYFIGYYLKQ